VQVHRHRAWIGRWGPGTTFASAAAAGVRVHVHTLEFTDRNRLSSAFERIISDEYVEDCLVETEHLRIRFVAVPERAAPLIARIYQDGGLRFAQCHQARALMP
jgi:hypothetical protein